MTTYVLGAGASVHAGYPLANELGSKLRTWAHCGISSNDEHRISIDRIHDLYGGLDNLEKILTDLEQVAPGSVAATIERGLVGKIRGDLRMSMREFFNDLRDTSTSLYARFAVQNVRPGDTIITFNYDLACERELRKARLWEIGNGYGFSLNIEGLPLSKVRILKLHGSTNWFALLFGGRTSFGMASDSIGERPVIFCQPDYEFLGYPAGVRDSLCARITRSAGWPAIIMPTLTKRFFEQTSFGREWEDFWESLWNQAGVALQTSNRIVIIGYGMAEADKRAQDLLLRTSNRDAQIEIYCGATRSKEMREMFLSNDFRHVITSGDGTFERFLSV